MPEYALAIVREVLVQTQSRTAPTQQARERRLARLQRLGPQVLAVQFEEVEGVEEDMLAGRLAPQPLEHREPIVIAGDRLAIDQAGTHLEPVNGLDDERIARSPVVPIAGQQADAGWVSARHQAIAVMLDLVNPVRPGRSAVGWGWEAGFDKTGGHLGAVYRLRPSRPLAISPDRSGLAHQGFLGGRQLRTVVAARADGRIRPW